MYYFKKIVIKFFLFVVCLLLTPAAFADFNFSSTSFSAEEDSGAVTVSVSLSASCFGECYDSIVVDYSVSSGTASSGVDFTPVSGQLMWMSNSTQAFQIPIIADSDIEPNETIVVTLNNCQEISNASSFSCDSREFTLSPITATANIINDDFFTLRTISLSDSTANVVEGGNATFSVSRTGSSEGAVSIDYATSNNTALAGSDYTASFGTLNWADGDSGSKLIVIETLTDLNNEGSETFNLSLSNPGGDVILGSTSNSIITIENLEAPGVISINSSIANVIEGGSATISVSRTGGIAGAVSIDYATSNNTALAGSDYTASFGTLNWADGESGSKLIVIETLTDLNNEGSEAFNLNLSNPGGDVILGSPSSSIITIEELETSGAFSLSSSTANVAEGGSVTFSVSRTGGSDGAVSIDYATSNNTALAGNDYTASLGTLNWADGESGSQTITLATLTDALIEDDESFTVTLSNPVGGATLSSESSSSTITITNTIQLLSKLESLTPNQKSVAKVLDEMCDGATDDLFLRCQEILNSGLTNDQLIGVIESIIPAQISAQGSIAIDFGFQQLQTVHGRIVSLRQSNGQGNRISLAGFTMNSFGQQVPIGQIAQALIYNALNDASPDEPLRDSPLGVFIKGQIDIGDKNSTGSEKGFEINTKSITLGFDYQFTDQLVLGIASGYGHTDSDFDNNGGEMESHSGNFSIYGSYFLPHDFYIDGILSYAINDYDNSRVISYSGLKTSATSTPFGDQYGGSLGLGKDFYVKNFFFSPYARIEYLRTGIDGYSEKGGSGLALKVSEQSMFSLASTLGGQMSHAFSMPWGVISPGMRFEWRHQFRDDQRSIQSQFINSSTGTGNFSIRTDDPDRDYFNLGASLAITLSEGRSAFIRYETRLGQNDMTNHTIEAAIRMPF